MAARIACELTVIKAIKTARAPASTNIHHCISIRYAKFSNHLCIIHQARGEAMIMALRTSLTNSMESMRVISETVAPITFRTYFFSALIGGENSQAE